MKAPSFRALGAGVGSEPAFMMKIKNFDTRFRRVENPFIFIRTGHFAL
jgi:hypothetical protein